MKKVNYIGLLLVTLLFASCDLDKYPYLSSTYKCNFLGADNKQ